MTYTIPYILKELPTLKEKKRKERTSYTQRKKKKRKNLLHSKGKEICGFCVYSGLHKMIIICSLEMKSILVLNSYISSQS